jgi:hypothetical protein
LLSGQSSNHERIAQTAKVNPELQACSASCKGKAQAHLLPRPGCARLAQPLGYTQLPRPLGYTWLPQPLGYTQLPRLLGYTQLPQPNTYGIIQCSRSKKSPLLGKRGAQSAPETQFLLITFLFLLCLRNYKIKN